MHPGDDPDACDVEDFRWDDEALPIELDKRTGVMINPMVKFLQTQIWIGWKLTGSGWWGKSEPK